MNKYKVVSVGAVLAFGAGVLAPVGVMAEASPTTCGNLDNCAVVTTGAELSAFFTSTGNGKFVTREGESTIIVGADFAMTKDFYIEDSDITMYLGGHTVTADDWSFLMYNSTLDIYADEGGSISNANEGKKYAPLYVRDDSEVTLHSGVIRGGLLPGYDSAVNVEKGGVFTMEAGEIYGPSWVVSVYGDSEFIMNGGTITTTADDSIGVSGNGTADPTKANYGGNARLILNAGTINSRDLGVYAPQINGETVLGEGLTINADKAGVEVRAGELIINGATINVPETAEYAFNPNGNGSTASGVGISVSQHTTKQPINVEIQAGTFTAPVALGEANPQHNPDEDVEQVEISVTGGTFNATNGDPIVTSEDVTNFISGGIYNKEFNTTYLEDGYSLYAAGDKYAVLKTMTPEGKDESGETDEETAAGNEDTLKTVSNKVMSALVEGLLTNPEQREFETSEGYKFTINDGVNLNEIMTSGATISSSFVESEATLTEEEAVLVNGVMTTGMVAYGTLNYGIELQADGVTIGWVSELPESLTLTINVASAPEVAEGYTRTWKLIRLHDGVATVLDAEYNEMDKTVQANSGLFSTFVAVYTDTATESESDTAVTAPDTGAATDGNAGLRTNAIIVSVIVAVVTGMVTAWKLVVRKI